MTELEQAIETIVDAIDNPEDARELKEYLARFDELPVPQE